jgi:hypothetical protein
MLDRIPIKISIREFAYTIDCRCPRPTSRELKPQEHANHGGIPMLWFLSIAVLPLNMSYPARDWFPQCFHPVCA